MNIAEANTNNESETRIVYCIPDRETLSDTEQGSLRPVFEETDQGILIPANKDDYINNGKIHVTKGYHQLFSSANERSFFRVIANISSSWSPDASHDGISKFVTYHRNSEPAKYLEIIQVIDGEYPAPEKPNGLTLTSPNLPNGSFFLKCLNPAGKQTLIGPLDVVDGSARINEGSFTYDYKAPNKPFGGSWVKINGVPHCTLSFDVDLIPDGVLVFTLDSYYLINTNTLPFLSSELLDLSSDENIVKWAQKLLRRSDPEIGGQLNKIKELLSSIPKDISIPSEIEEARKARLKLIPEKISKLEGIGQIFADYIKSDEGEKAIRQHVEANRDRLVKQYFEDAVQLEDEKAKNEVSNITNQLKVHRSEKDSLIKQIEDLRDQKLKIENSKLGIELDEIQSQLEKLRKEKGILLEVSELETQKKLVQNDIDKLAEKKTEAETLLANIQEKIHQSQDTHKKRLLELKMNLDAISGYTTAEADLRVEISKPGNLNVIHSLASDSNQSKREVIDHITKTLQRRGRIVNSEEVAILTTCIIQNLIVTLAGKPGAGKSSTASEIASALGIRQSGKYTHIQVQRGWSSDRDLLGFYNKLNHCYDPDRFGLYKLINSLQDLPRKNQLSIALLDEANLSPIEHYWSGFMGACDDPSRFSTQGQNLKLPDGLRFIATVNYDRTTEPLSARFIDRSPVIYIDDKENRQSITTSDSEEETEQILEYSFEDLTDLFIANDNPTLSGDENRILEDILEEHRFLPIKHRKINSIKLFTHTLRNVIADTPSETLKALDYAILIHVLPMINGQGRDYANVVKQFSGFLEQQGLTQSTERLRDIIDHTQFESYSYFI